MQPSLFVHYCCKCGQTGFFSILQVLSVEYIHDKGGREAVKKFMTSKGFRIFGEVRDPRNLANDFIFVNNRIR